LAALQSSTALTTPWGNVTGAGSGAIAAGSKAKLAVDRNGKSVPIDVNVTLTNGTQAAVRPVQINTLTAGDRVVIGTTGGQNSPRANGARSPMNASPFGAGVRGIHS
jgi:hypothetical protein